MPCAEGEVNLSMVEALPLTLGDVTIGPRPTRLAERALELLAEGNERFVKGDLQLHAGSQVPYCAAPLFQHVSELPSTVVLTCSDSTIPPDMLFDQGAGDLYNVRIGGNALNEQNLGAIAFAIEKLGARLVVIMGHTGCTFCLASVRHAISALQRDDVEDMPSAPPPVISPVSTSFSCPSLQELEHTYSSRSVHSMNRLLLRKTQSSLAAPLQPAITRVLERKRSGRLQGVDELAAVVPNQLLEGLTALEGALLLDDSSDCVDEVAQMNARLGAAFARRLLRSWLVPIVFQELVVVAAYLDTATGLVHFLS